MPAPHSISGTGAVTGVTAAGGGEHAAHKDTMKSSGRSVGQDVPWVLVRGEGWSLPGGVEGLKGELNRRSTR